VSKFANLFPLKEKNKHSMMFIKNNKGIHRAYCQDKSHDCISKKTRQMNKIHIKGPGKISRN